MNATFPEDARLCRCICCFCKLRVTNSYIVDFFGSIGTPITILKRKPTQKSCMPKNKSTILKWKDYWSTLTKGGIDILIHIDNLIYSVQEKSFKPCFAFISTAKTLQAGKDNLTKGTKSGLHNCTDTETEQGFIWSTNQQQSTLLLRTCMIRMQRRPSSQCKKTQNSLLGLKSIIWLSVVCLKSS